MAKNHNQAAVQKNISDVSVMTAEIQKILANEERLRRIDQMIRSKDKGHKPRAKQLREYGSIVRSYEAWKQESGVQGSHYYSAEDGRVVSIYVYAHIMLNGSVPYAQALKAAVEREDLRLERLAEQERKRQAKAAEKEARRVERLEHHRSEAENKDVKKRDLQNKARQAEDNAKQKARDKKAAALWAKRANQQALKAKHAVLNNELAFYRAVNDENPIVPQTSGQEKAFAMLKNAKQSRKFLMGPPGTGKTYMSLAYAADMLRRHQDWRIKVIRPRKEAGKGPGFLQGDLQEKTTPFMKAVHSNCDKLGINRNLVDFITPDFERGETYEKCVVIVSEAQNLIWDHLDMLYTRGGEDCVILFEGDVGQTDIPLEQAGGMLMMMNLLEDSPYAGFVTLDIEDIVRHDHLKDYIMRTRQVDLLGMQKMIIQQLKAVRAQLKYGDYHTDAMNDSHRRVQPKSSKVRTLDIPKRSARRTNRPVS